MSGKVWLRVQVTAVVLLAFAGSASALVINFDDQGLTGPDLFASAGPAQHLDITVGSIDVDFDGGVILDNTTFLPANQTALYGTAFFGDATLTNPLTVTFSSAITNFFLDVYNGQTFDVMYRVSDNAGNSADFTLVPNLSSGVTTIGFAATGTVVTIEALTNPTEWDFFIDNITFNEPLPPGLVPEPSTLLLLGAGIGMLALRKRSSH